jgi:four helix bundle protein
MKERDLERRLFRFSIDVLKMLSGIKGGRETDVIKFQLSKSATSSGANYKEAQAGSSKPDFTNKVAIALKEMRESNYWLSIISELLPDTKDINLLVSESEELSRILASILIKVRS